MNKWLLVWNMVITILMVGTIISGCSSIDPEFSSLANQVKSNRAAIEQLADAVNGNRKLIGEQANSILQLKVYTETVLNQFQGTPE